MRMVNYFAVAAIATVAALLAAAAAGIWYDGGERHLTLGLLAGVLSVGTHSLMIMFMIITGRVLKSAMQTRDLDKAYLEELNVFFERKGAYPLALLAATLTVAAGVMGYGQRAFGLSPLVHMLLGIATVLFNLWALQSEWFTLRENQSLLDRTARELDRLDLEVGVPELPEEPVHWSRKGPIGWVSLALGAWLPYLYWGVIVWRGDFSRVSLHPWIEISAFFLLLFFLSLGRAASPAAPADGPADSSTGPGGAASG